MPQDPKLVPIEGSEEQVPQLVPVETVGVPRLQAVEQDIPEQDMSFLRFTEESARNGMRIVGHALSRLAYPIRAFPATVPAYGMYNLARRMMDPDLAKQQDAEVTEALKSVDSFLDETLGAQRNKPLLKPIESPKELLDIRRLTNLALEQGPLMALQIGAYMANPVAGSVLMANVEYGGQREAILQAEEKGGSLPGYQRELIPLVGGILSASLERLGAEPLLAMIKNPAAKSKIISVLTAMAVDPFTEVNQDALQIIAGKSAEYGDIAKYAQELIDNGVDSGDMKQLQHTFWSSLALTGMAGGSIAGLQQFAETATRKQFADVQRLVEEDIAAAKEIVNSVPVDIPDTVRRTIAQEAGELEVLGETDLAAYTKAAGAGQFPMYIGLPKRVVDYAQENEISINSVDDLINLMYRGLEIDPATLTPELASYVRADAIERFQDLNRLGVGFATKNVAMSKWGNVTKSIAEELKRRITVAKGVLDGAGTLIDLDKQITLPNMGNLTPYQTNVNMTPEDAQVALSTFAELQRLQGEGSLPPHFIGRSIYDMINKLRDGKPLQDVLQPVKVGTQTALTQNLQETLNKIQAIVEERQAAKDAAIAEAAALSEANDAGTEEVRPDIYEEGQILHEETKRKDAALSPMNKSMTPVFALRKFPDAQKYAQAIVDADNLINKETYRHYGFFDELIGILKNKERRLKMRKAMDILYGDNLQAKGALLQNDPALHEAASKLISWFGRERKRIKDYKRLMIALTLKPDMVAAFDSVLKGNLTATDASAAYKVNANELIDLLVDYLSVDTWGLDNYVTNAMRGSWKAVDKDGHVKVIGVTKKQLVARVKEYFEQNKGVNELFIDTEGHSIDDGTPMSKRAYFAMHGNISRALYNDVAGMSRSLANAVAGTALQGTVTIKPSRKFSPFLTKRKGVLEGEADVFDILYSYAHSVTKKIHLDPVLYVASQAIDSMPPNVRQILLQQMEDVKGRYYQTDQVVDAWFSKAGETKIGRALNIGTGEPFRASRAAAVATKGTAIAKLGYRVIGMFVNKLGGEMHVWSRVGPRYAIRAKKWLDTAAGKEFIAEMDAIGALGNTFAVHKKLNLPWWHALYLFNKPEAGLRKFGLAANYLLAKDFGYSDRLAKYHARMGMQAQLFLYNTAAIPRILRDPLGRVAGQFRAYLVQELQFISQLNPKQMALYTAMFMAIGGPRAVIAFLKSLPLIGAVFGLDEMERWANAVWPRLYRGVAGLFGGDISAPAGWQLPGDIRDVAGAFFGEIIKFYTGVLGPMADRAFSSTGIDMEMTKEDFKKWLGQLATIQKSISGLIDAVISHDGWVRDTQGNQAYRPDAAMDLVWLTLGATPLSKSQQDAAERIYMRELKIGRENYERAMNRLVKKHHFSADMQNVVEKLEKYVADGGTLPIPVLNALTEYAYNVGDITQEDIDKLVLYGLTNGDVIGTRIEKSYLPPQMRRIEEAKLAERLKALNAFDLEYGQ